MDFKRQLQQQLGFLQRSCDSYDAGHTGEGVRIATIARVLIHETKHSTPLLKHLGALHIMLASTVAIAPPGGRTILKMGMGRTTLSVKPGTASGGTWAAAITPDSIKTHLSVTNWWTQQVYIMGSTQISRKDLILTAANKDGGAHVDATLTKDYETLMSSGCSASAGNGESVPPLR